MTEIRYIDVLYQPNWVAPLTTEFKKSNPSQVELQESWNQRIEYLSKRPDSALIYFSLTNYEDIERYFQTGGRVLPFRNDFETPVRTWDAKELMRVGKIKSQLRDRAVIIGGNITPRFLNYPAEFLRHGLQYDSNDTQLYCYGGVSHQSLNFFGQDIRRALGILRCNLNIAKPPLCLEAN